MDIKIVVNDKTVSLGQLLFSKRTAVFASVAGLMVAASVVAATPSAVPYTFAAGDVVSATKINENFQTVINAVADVDTLAGSKADAGDVADLTTRVAAAELLVGSRATVVSVTDLTTRVAAAETSLGTKASVTALNAAEDRVTALEGSNLRLVDVFGNNGGVSCTSWCVGNGLQGCVLAYAQNFRTARGDGYVGCGTVVKEFNGGAGDSMTCRCIGL